MRIAVVGTGAVGGYFGGRLAQAGEDVVFLARGAHLHAIQEHGLQVESVDGDFAIRPAQVTDDPTGIGSVDLVLLAVKGWQVSQAIETMRPLVGPQTFVVPLLNGVEAPEQLAAVFGAHRALGGLCGLFGSVVGPGRIRNVLPRPFVTIGELDHATSRRSEQLRQAFEHAGVQVSIAADIHAALWEKLLFVGPPQLARRGGGHRASAGGNRPLSRTGHRFDAAGHHGGPPLGTGVANRRGGAAGASGGGRGAASQVSLCQPASPGAQGAWGDRVSRVRHSLQPPHFPDTREAREPC